ncbi:SCO1431 family membrane protein [Streptomyces sp. KLOTTS4A1]|uniref:SCO1431 family membrane protein n=1 Tax=Streptomyces sp. KLOTTS4A1 TaxID=3390996 RepID=UPI0039F4F16B
MSETVMNSSSGAHAAANTAEVAEYVRSRTGGPRDHGPKILEHLAGWTLVVVLAMFVTQTGLL